MNLYESMFEDIVSLLPIVEPKSFVGILKVKSACGSSFGVGGAEAFAEFWSRVEFGLFVSTSGSVLKFNAKSLGLSD